jgi:hypothetical protein
MSAPHNAQVVVLGGQHLYEVVLHPVRVLVFVYQYVLPASLVVAEHRGIAAEELDSEQEQVAEVERFCVRENLLIFGVDIHREFVVEVDRVLGRTSGQEAVVLPLIDAPAVAFGVVLFGVEVQSLQRLLHDPDRVRVVVDHEASGTTEMTDVPPQNSHTGRVEGAEPESRGVSTEGLLDPLAHLVCGLVGKGHGEDVFAGNPAVPDQVGDAMGEYPGLARPRPRQHEQWAFDTFDGFALFQVETVENRFEVQGVEPPGALNFVAGGGRE